MEPGRAADKPAAHQYGLPVDTQQMEAHMAIFMVIVPRAVRLRLEASGVGPHRYGVEGDLPVCDRQVLLHVHSGTVYKGQAVLGHLLVQHDVDSTEGELPGPEFHPGRTGTDEGGLPENHPYHYAGLVRAAFRPVGCSGVPADGAHRPPVEGGRPLSSDNLLRGIAVSSARHQPEHAPGAGTFGPVPEAGDSEEDHRRRPSAAGNFPEHRLRSRKTRKKRNST